jgi:hypothetical protein
VKSWRWLAQRGADALLAIVALVAAAWALLLSALCIGDACSEDLTVRWWAWLAIVAAIAGGVLVFSSRTRRLGRVVLTVPVIVAIVVTFTGG